MEYYLLDDYFIVVFVVPWKSKNIIFVLSFLESKRKMCEKETNEVFLTSSE